MTDRITRKVIIDTDPSADDAVALMLAMVSPELEILGMSAAFGVCDSARSIKNILKIQTRFRQYRGQKCPLFAAWSLTTPTAAATACPRRDFRIRRRRRSQGRPGALWRRR